MPSLVEAIGTEIMQSGVNYIDLAELVARDRAGEAQRTSLEFPQIQEALDSVLGTVIGGQIPRLLVERLRLSNFTWTNISDPHCRSALLIAGDHDINDALAIIEIEKWERESELTTYPATIRSSLEPWNLRISGVIGENGADHRILAVQYGEDVAGNNTANAIQVSVREEEIPVAEASPFINTETADFSEKEGYKRAGLVTPAMINKVYDPGQTARALNLEVQKMSVGIYTQGAERYGFRSMYINEYGRLAAIGYQERDHPPRSSLKFPNDSWGILVPLRLEKEGYS